MGLLMDITPIKKDPAAQLVITASEQLISHQVDTVVQEYMDTMLVDLFPEIPTVADISEPDEPRNTDVTAQMITSQSIREDTLPKSIRHEPIPIHSKLRNIHGPNNTSEAVDTESQRQPSKSVDITDKNVIEKSMAKPAHVATLSDPIHKAILDSNLEVKPQQITTIEQTTLPASATEIKIDTPVIEALTIKKTEPLRYPQAPVWAQQSFDVLLFNVCGLKLAVPMEALGRIIKVEHETSQLIGRPDWFMGAYNEHEHHFYVVDTAKYIMPEKGFDQATTGFEYLIQLQRSKWTLACQAVHTTIRLEPEQVKWRSNHSSRQWLAGTVIEHMCALITVDSLIELLEKQG